MLFCCRVKICWVNTFLKLSEATARVLGVYFKISHISEEKICVGACFLINPEGLQLYVKRLQHRCFPVKFAIFLRTPKFFKPQPHNLSISYWMDCFSLHPIIHVINLLFNDVICIYFPCPFILLHLLSTVFVYISFPASTKMFWLVICPTNSEQK